MVNGDRLSWYRGALPPGARSPLQLVMIQSTSFCNIDCSYCYLPLRNSKARFDLDRLPTLIAKLTDAGLIDDVLTFSWHAGEPLVLPADWYRRAFSIAAAHAPAGVTVRHCFQTNAILLSDEYARFFKETGANVGVSIDGPQSLHDARRTTRDGKGTFERAMAGISRLREQAVPFTTISVLGAEALEQPDQMYDFFKSLGPLEVGFNIEEIEGENLESSLAGAEMEVKVRSFFRRLAERVSRDPQPLRIRELANGRGAALGALANAGGGGSSENNPLSIISVDTEGRISTFSPELLQMPGEVDAYTFGTVETIDFTRIWQNNAFAAMHADIEKGVAMCRETCSYFGACQGGAPANKLAENGTFASAETMHCRLSKQVVIDLTEELLLAELQAKQARRPALGTTTEAAVPAPPAAQPVSLAPQPRQTRIVTSGAKPNGVAVIKSDELRSLFGGAAQPPLPVRPPMAFRMAPSSERPALNPLFPHLGTFNIFAPGDRLSITRGTRGPNEDEPDYKPNARLPHPEWWRLTETELSAIRSPLRSPGPLNYAAVVRLPEEARAAALELGATLTSGSSAAGPRDGGVLEQRLADQLTELFSPGRETKLLGSLVQPGNLLTTTLDPSDDKRQGLHVDSWSKRGPLDRATAPNRICVNLGTSPRRLLLLDLGLDQIAGLMSGVPVDNPTDIARAFLALHPTYPVLAVEVHPGEAYVAATENLVHDGSSVGSGAPDVTMTVMGEFRRADVAPYFALEEAMAAR